MNSKAKGSAGERELCSFLTSEGYPATRNDQRYVGGRGNPDVSAEGMEGYHIECKRVERLNINEAMRQAIDDADGTVPVVMSRRNRGEWLATMRLKDWLKHVSVR